MRYESTVDLDRLRAMPAIQPKIIEFFEGWVSQHTDLT
jgi:hypothetical protein